MKTRPQSFAVSEQRPTSEQKVIVMHVCAIASHLSEIARTEGLDFPLLSDLDGLVATAYGVRRKLITPVKRATFVIDQQQRIVDVIASETNMQVHADKALKALEHTVSPA